MLKKEDEILYEDVFAALNDARIDYAVCGGLAVVLYGYARLTVDLDLIVGLDKENLAKLYDVLAKMNYRFKIPIKKEDFIQKQRLQKLEREKNMKVVSFYNTDDPMKVIDVGVNLPNVDEILKKKKYVKIKKLKVPIISMAQLIKMKEDLARPRDLNDVKNLKKIEKAKAGEK